jgi:hypothetical protein
MISAETDYIYNVILSIILGIIVVLLLNQLFTTPQIIKIDREAP